MAVSEEQFERYIKLMETSIRDGSLGFGGRGERGAGDIVAEARRNKRHIADEIKWHRRNQALRDKQVTGMELLNSKMVEFGRTLSDQSKIYSEAFMESTGALKEKHLELVPEAISTQLQKSPIFKKENIKTLSDTFDFYAKIDAQRNLFEKNEEGIDALEEFKMKGLASSTATLEKMRIASELSGKSMNELTASRKRLTEEVKRATDVQEKYIKAATAGQKFVTGVQRATEGLAKLRQVLKVAAEGITDTFVPAFRHGTDAADAITAAMAGMKPDELAQNVAMYRQSIRAAGMSIDDFRNITESSAGALVSYTGTLKEAVQLQSSAFEAARRMGIEGQENMRSFMNTQIETFKKFNMVFSMTSKEFIEMNNQIKKSTSINEHMYRLNQKQRAQTFINIQQTALQLRTMGLMKEQTMKVVEAMSALAAKSPRERLKQAARLQAVGGALGFGAEAARAAQAIRTGKTETPEFAKDMQAMQKQLGQFMGQGLPQELMATQILQTTQLQDLLGPKSAFSDLNKEQFQATERIGELMEKRNEQGSKMLAWMQRFSAFMQGPIMKTLTGIWNIIGDLAVGLIGGAIVTSMLKQMAGLTAGAAGKGLLMGVIRGALKFFGPVGIAAALGLAIVGIVKTAMAATSDEERKPLEGREKRAFVKRAVEDSFPALGRAEGALGGIKDFSILPEEFTKFDPTRFMPKHEEWMRIAGQEMKRSEFEALPLQERRELKLEHAINQIEKQQKEMLFKEENRDFKADKAHEDNKERLDKQLELLQLQLLKIQDPDQGVIKQLEMNNRAADDRHKEAMEKADKKDVKVVWARDAGMAK